MEELSPDELRLRLIESFQTSGLKDKLKVFQNNKAQVRSKLYAELTLVTQIQSDQTPKLVQRIIDSLFIEYLKSRDLDFTVSVFVPECGLGSISHALERDDLIHALHINQDILKRIGFVEEKPVLVQLLAGLLSIFNRQVMDQQSQTNVELDDLLHMKLRGIDQSVRYQSQQHEKRQLQMLEERLHSVQSELEERFQKKFEEQIVYFKQVEVARMRMEEKKHYQSDLDRQQSIFDDKLLQVESKYLETMEMERTRLKERERELERSYLKLKQEMLDENHNAIFKEKQLRNETELQAKQLEMERNQLKKRMEEVQNQVNSLSQFKEKYTQKMEESMAQYKIDLNKEYSSLLSSVEIEKAKLDADRMMLTEKQAMVEKMLSKVHETEAEAARYRLEVQDLQSRIEDLNKQKEEISYQSKEYQLQLLTHKGSSNLEFEVSSLKRQLAAAEKSAEQRQLEYENLIKTMMDPKDNTQKELQKAKESELKWKAQCQDLIMKLDSEFAHSDQLAKRLSQEKIKNKELERELADVRLVLHQSQSALALQHSHKLPTFQRSQDPIELRYSQISSKPDHRDKIPHPSAFEDMKSDVDVSFQLPSPIKMDSPYRSTSVLEDPFFFKDDPIIQDDNQRASIPEKSLIPKATHKDDILTRKDQALLASPVKKEEPVKSVPVFKLTSPERRFAPPPEKAEYQARESETKRIDLEQDRLDQEKRDAHEKIALQKEQERRELLERERKLQEEREKQEERDRLAKLEEQRAREEKLAQEKRAREEQERIAQEQKKPKAEEELSKLDNIAQDPLLQKYLNLVKEKRTAPVVDPKSSSESEIKFDQGDTADEMSAPENVDSSSGGPSW